MEKARCFKNSQRDTKNIQANILSPVKKHNISRKSPDLKENLKVCKLKIDGISCLELRKKMRLYLVSFKKPENVLGVCREEKEKSIYSSNKLKKKPTATKVSIWQLKQQKIKVKLLWLNVNVQENRLVLRQEDFNKKFKILLFNYQINRNVYNSRKTHINNNFASLTKSTLKVKTKDKNSHLTTTLFWPNWNKQKSAIKQTQKRKTVPILNKRIN